MLIDMSQRFLELRADLDACWAGNVANCVAPRQYLDQTCVARMSF